MHPGMRKVACSAMLVLVLGQAASASPLILFSFDEDEGQFTNAHRDAIRHAADLWAQWLDPAFDTTILLSAEARWDPDHDTAWASADHTFWSEMDVWQTTGQAAFRTGESGHMGRVGYSTTRDWYTGLDGQPGSGEADMVTTTLHEIGHLLGMTSSYRGGTTWGYHRGLSGRKLNHFDLFLRDMMGLAPTTGNSPFIVADPITFVGPAATAYHGQPVRIFAPDPDPDEGEFPNIAHPVETGGVMTYGGRTPSQHGLFDYEVGMFEDLGLRFAYPTQMQSRILWQDGWFQHNVWHNGANWGWGLPPTADVDVHIHKHDLSMDSYFIHVTKPVAARDLTIQGSTFSNQADIRILGQGELNVRSAQIGTGGSGNGRIYIYEFEGDSGRLNVEQELSVGHGRFGRLNVWNGGRAASATGVIGHTSDGFGRVEIAGEGSRWDNAGAFTAALAGTAYLDIFSGGVLSTGHAVAAANPGASATIDVTGTDSRWYASSINIAGTSSGPGGAAELTVGNHAAIRAGTVRAWAGGTIDVLADGILDVSFLDVQGGTVTQHAGGALSASNSGWTNFDGTVIGVDAGSVGTVRVNNGTLNSTRAFLSYLDGASANAEVAGLDGAWHIEGAMYVGYRHQAIMHVENRGQVTTLRTFLGRFTGSNATVNIISPDDNNRLVNPASAWINQQDFNVGYQGTGTLNVDVGGHLQTGSLAMGFAPPNDGLASSGTVRVAGGELVELGPPFHLVQFFPSRIDVTTTAWVGYDGVGQLDVLDGGQFHANQTRIGLNGSASGNVTVAGGGSHLETGTLVVGNAGTGFLTVSDGGHVQAGNTMIAQVPGSYGELRLRDEGTTFHASNLRVGGTADNPGGLAYLYIELDASAHVDGSVRVWNQGHVVLPAGQLHAQTLDVRGGFVELMHHAVLNLDNHLALADGSLLSIFDGQLHTASLATEPGATLDFTGGTITVAGGDAHFGHITSMQLDGTDPGNFPVYRFQDGADGVVQFGWRIAREADTFGHTTVMGVSDDGVRTTLRGTGGGGGADLYVGDRGAGSLQLLDGALADFADDLIVGGRDDGIGNALVSGVSGGYRATILANRRAEQSEVMVGGTDASDAVGGAGALIIRDGALVETTGHVYMGRTPGGEGIIIVGQSQGGYDAELRTPRSVLIGGDASQARGQGTLLLEDGGRVDAQESVHVWGTGLLSVTGGTLVTHSLIFEPDSELHFTGGTMIVSGVTSYGDAHCHCFISGIDTPTLEMVAGGLLETTATFRVAAASGESGRLRVIGYREMPAPIAPLPTRVRPADADAGDLVVGYAGHGMLEVADGGLVDFATAGHDVILARAGGSAAVSVSGTDRLHVPPRINPRLASTLRGRDVVLAAGDNADASLAVSDGGAVHATGDMLLAQGNGANAQLSIAGGVGAFLATVDVAGGLYAGITPTGQSTIGQSMIEIGPGGVLNVADETVLALSNAIRVDGGRFQSDSLVLARGHVQLTAGQMHLDTIDVIGSGTLDLDGGLASFRLASTDVLNSGAVITSPTAAPGTITIEGDYTQTAGTLRLDLAGTAAGIEHDHVQIDTILRGGGTLAVRLIDGFAPEPGDIFDLLSFSTVDTVFDHLDLPDLPQTLAWNIDALYTDGLLAVDIALLLGDMNLDGVVDTGDVAPFVQALTDPATYITQFGIDETTMITLGDINQDGAFDTGDVAAFVEVLVGNGSVPEPGSLALLGLGAMGLLRRGRA